MKFKSRLLAVVVFFGATTETIVKDLPALLKLEDAIDLALDQVRPGALDEDLPVIQQEDLDVSDVPF